MNQKIRSFRADLLARFPERSSAIDACLAALLAAEHVCLLGPPGTAKSSLIRAIAKSFGATYYEALMTRFTVPEEILGPVSLAGLEHDRFKRITTGRLPEAEVVFLDEIYKSSSAILNVILGILNERLFVNDGVPVACPLISLFAASNELPDSKDLEALHDRLLVRLDVQYLLSANNMRQVLMAPDPMPSVQLTMADLRAAQGEVAKVQVSDATVDGLISIRDACRAEGIIASDRRYKRSLKLVQAVAWMAGERVTSPEDLCILQDSLWREPAERNKVARLVGRLADPVGCQAAEILDAAREVAQKVAAMSSGERKSYIAQAAQTVDQFTAQQGKLAELARSAGRRAKVVIADASAEIQQMHAELARTVSAGLGLRALR